MRSTIDDYVPDIAPISAEEIIEAGQHRQRNKRLAGLTASMVVAVVAVILAAQIFPTGREGRPVNAAASTVVPSSPQLSPGPSETDSPTCPAPTPTGEVRELLLYTRMVVWKGATYDLVEEPGSPADRLGVVPCNIAEIQDRAQAVWNGPWPDGSSTFVTVGSPIHAQKGEDPACALTVQFEGEWMLLRTKDC